MRTQSRKSLLLFSTVALLGLAIAGVAFAPSLSAADAPARPQAAPAQETPAGATGTVTATTGAEIDHAAHHPQSSETATSPAEHGSTAPESGTMQGGMMGMMGHADAVYGSIAADMGEWMDLHAESMTPKMAAHMGMILGRMESMNASMADMHGNMKECMAGGMMQGGMMQGGMMQGGMMQGGMMQGGMPMTDTMPMTHDMPMTGTMPMTHDMPMTGSMPMTHDMPMTSSTPVMEGMDHGATANHDQHFDAMFIDSMIEHHLGAIAMAEIVLEQAEHDELLTMAEAIIAAQEGEIDQMRSWRAEWYPDLPASEGMGMAMGDMAISEDATIAFDRRFLEAMISHHRGAIMMAEAALTQAEHDQIRELAQAIIAAQEAEIAQMQQWLQEWYDVQADAAPAHAHDSMTGMTDMEGMTGQMAIIHAMHSDMETMMAQVPEAMAGRMHGLHARMGDMMSMMEGMESGTMSDGMMGELESSGTVDHMAAMTAEMGAMHDEMQAMMDEMMGDGDITSMMAGEMGRMMGRMQGMSGMMPMMGMMSGGMMKCPMMDNMMEDSN